MRILHLCERYAPFVGGMEQAVANLLGAQRAAGDEAHLATLRPDGLRAMTGVEDSDGFIHRLRHLPLGNYHPPAPDPVVSRGLLQLLRRFGPFDVVHAHGLMGLSYLALKRAGIARTPLVWTLHDYGLVCAKRTLLYRDGQPCSGPACTKCLRCSGQHYGVARGALVTAGVWGSRAFMAGVDRFVAVSEIVAVAHGAIDATIIPPGISDYEVDRAEPRPGFLPTGPYLMFVGRLAPAKGGPVLLEAYGQLEGVKPRLLVITSDETDPEIAEAGVQVARGVPHHDVRSAWSHALFGVQPSLCDETWGMAIAEAMAAGKAVVVSDAGALPGVVGDGGIVVPRGDPGSLARAMQQLIGSSLLRERLGSAGRERAKSYGVENVRRQVLAVYEEVTR
jgi:glycosyltransferase involved in cell wall biosynthesis